MQVEQGSFDFSLSLFELDNHREIATEVLQIYSTESVFFFF